MNTEYQLRERLSSEVGLGLVLFYAMTLGYAVLCNCALTFVSYSSAFRYFLAWPFSVLVIQTAEERGIVNTKLCLSWCFLRPTWLHIPECLALVEWSHHREYLGSEDLFLCVWRSFLYSSVYSCHLFLISYASVRSIPLLSFIEHIFAWNVPLISPVFLKRSLVFPILLFSSILCIDRWERLSYLSLLFFGALHSNGYIFPLNWCKKCLFLWKLFWYDRDSNCQTNVVFLDVTSFPI